MSRTYHHSGKWGKDHVFADRSDRATYRRDRGPGWFNTLYMHRPGRRKDRKLVHLILTGLDPEEAVFERTGNHRPHEYYW